MHMIRRETGWVFSLLFLVLILGSASPAVGQDTLRHTEDSESPDYHSHRFDEPERYAERWNDPRRDDWQKPGVLIEAMGVEKGMTVADLGAGTGYFLPHLSKAVGPNGRVLAVDIEPAMLEYIRNWTSEEGIDNVQTVHADPEDTHLDASSVDRILTVNTRGITFRIGLHTVSISRSVYGTAGPFGSSTTRPTLPWDRRKNIDLRPRQLWASWRRGDSRPRCATLVCLISLLWSVSSIDERRAVRVCQLGRDSSKTRFGLSTVGRVTVRETGVRFQVFV